MSKYVLNSALRFILELVTLFSIGYWAWYGFTGITSKILTFLLPAVIATIWGVFAVKDDPSRSGKTIIQTPGIIRLFIELAVFGFGCWCLFDLHKITLSAILLIVVIMHYLISFSRIIWLLKQK